MKSALAAAALHAREASCGVCIAAAGDSTRFGAPKPFVQVGGKTLLEYSVDAFLRSRYVAEMVVAVRESELDLAKSILAARYPLDKVRVCLGGETRAQSTFLAFQQLSAPARFVAFHDAARPLITTADIDKVLCAAFRFGAASAAAPIFDSVKRADKKGCIAETVEREGLYAVSTPQVFSREIYEVSAALAKRDSFSGTDDNALAEHAGFSVRLVEVGENRKVTKPSNLDIVARVLLTREGTAP